MSKKSIDELKLESWQTEVQTIVNQFRNALNQHFDTVKYKAKKLIDTRWKEV